jgi:hypothetical protein
MVFAVVAVASAADSIGDVFSMIVVEIGFGSGQRSC